jgi:hypothetical protein
MIVSSRKRLSLCVSTLIGLGGLAACQSPSQPARAPEAVLADGETIPVSVTSNGQEDYRMVFTAIQLEEPAFRAMAAGQAVPPVPVLTSWSDSGSDATAEPGIGMPLQPVLTPDEVRQFVQRQWDAYKGGEADAGYNVSELLAELADNGLDVNRFIALHRESRLSLADFVTWLSILDDDYGSPDGDTAVLALSRTLHDQGLTTDRFIMALTMTTGAGTPSETGILALPEAAARDIFRGLARDNVDFAAFLAGVREQGGRLSEAIRQRLAKPMTAQQVHIVRDLSPFNPNFPEISYRKVWTTIKGSHPTHEAGAVVPTGDPDPDHLTGGVDWQSEEHGILVGLKELPLVDYKWRWQGKINCTTSLFPGKDRFIQHIKQVPTKQFASWPWFVQAQASMTTTGHFGERYWSMGSEITTILQAVLVGLLNVTIEERIRTPGSFTPPVDIGWNYARRQYPLEL